MVMIWLTNIIGECMFLFNYVCIYYIDITLFFVSSGKTTIPLARYRYDGDALGGDEASVDRSDDGNDSASTDDSGDGNDGARSAILEGMLMESLTRVENRSSRGLTTPAAARNKGLVEIVTVFVFPVYQQHCRRGGK
jgi:hypothetical protein